MSNLDARDVSPDDDLVGAVKVAAEWYDYAEGLTSGNRVVVRNPAYFDTLIAECLSCAATWAEPQAVFRARLMPPMNEDKPFPLAEMGAPPSADVHGARLNPVGIPYLYAATDIETAIAEVRPWVGARLTVATFETIGKVRVVDLTNPTEREATAKHAAFAGYMMQRPTHRDDRTAYVPTQFLAESLKARGVDAVLYGSRLKSGGVNIAFLRTEIARPIASQLWLVAHLTYLSTALTAMKGGHADGESDHPL